MRSIPWDSPRTLRLDNVNQLSVTYTEMERAANSRWRKTCVGDNPRKWKIGYRKSTENVLQRRDEIMFRPGRVSSNQRTDKITKSDLRIIRGVKSKSYHGLKFAKSFVPEISLEKRSWNSEDMNVNSEGAVLESRENILFFLADSLLDLIFSHEDGSRTIPETSVQYYFIKRHYLPEASNLHVYHHKN